METIKKSLRQLRWQLTLSYTIVTVGTLLVAVLILGPILLSQIFLPTNVLSPLDWYEIAKDDGPLIQELLEQDPIDYNLIRVLMGEMNNTITSRPILQMGALAAAKEAPFNVIQALSGLVGVPVYLLVARAYPPLVRWAQRG